MSTKIQKLSPRVLGFWVRCMRTSHKWSQEALAETSGLTPRTIQRIEAGEPVNAATRRSLARGLGYENYDVFDDPNFAVEIHKLLETISEYSEKEQYPDHIKILAVPVNSGHSIGNLIGISSGYLFNCEETLPSETQDIAHEFFDSIHDYADAWPDTTHIDRLLAIRNFDKFIKELENIGSHAYSAMRSAQITNYLQKDKSPLRITIGYLTIVSKDKNISHIMVPKRL